MKLRLSLLLVIALIYIFGNLWLNRWPNNFFYGDTNGYYLHIVSAFIYQDVGVYDQTVDAMLEANPNVIDVRKDPFLIRETEVGRKYIKYPLGVSIMASPFFLLGHGIAKLSNKYPTSGWSKPYFLMTGFAIISYVLIGFYLLTGVLQRYFSDRVVYITILAIAIGTNLFYHATYVTMAHGFLFFNYCLLIYLTDKFYRQPKFITGSLIGFTVGLIMVTRIPELVSAFIPILWGIVSWKSFTERLAFFVKHYLKLIGALIGFLVIVSIQISYWRYTSGYFIFNPYQGEGFDFTNPQIYNAWFNYANGWLIYTPLMVFSLIGLLLVRFYIPEVLLPILFFVGTHIYIHYCYYVWSYFPGLGNRPMVETYPIFAFSMAACFSFLLSKKWLSWIPYSAIIIGSLLNLFQTWQMNEGIIWSERHNRAFYWATFGKTASTYEALQAFESNELQPDTLSLHQVERLYFNDFEQLDSGAIDSSIVYSGNFALLPDRETITVIAEGLSSQNIQANDWVKVGIRAYTPTNNPVNNRDYIAAYVIHFLDENGRQRKSREFKISTFIGNPTGNIFMLGGLDEWGEAYLFVEVPREWNIDWNIKTFTYNGNKQKIFLDDAYIDLYKPL